MPRRTGLKRLGDINLFSKFLPYAVALDVADNWAKAFEGIYQDPPDWYVIPRGVHVQPVCVYSLHQFSDLRSHLRHDLCTEREWYWEVEEGEGLEEGVPQEVALEVAVVEAGDVNGMNFTLDLFQCPFSLMGVHPLKGLCALL